MAEQESPDTASSPQEESAPRIDPQVQLDTSYEDAIQARINRLGDRARKQRKQTLMWSAAAFVVLVVLTIVALLVMQQFGGGGAFKGVFQLK